MATVDEHLKQLNTPLAEEIRKNIYVDNVCFGTNSKGTIVGLCKEAKEYFASAKMNLRSSNAEDCIKQLQKEDQVLQTTKVLGHRWNLEEDSLEFKLPEAPTKITKRTMLATVASL